MKILLPIVLGLSLGLAGSPVHAAPVIVVADVGGILHTVDAATGGVSVLGNTGIIMADIAFDPNGQLYGISEDKLYRIDTTSAVTISSPQLIGTTGINAWSLVFGADGTLYAATTELYEISTANGQANLIGSGGYAYGANAFTGHTGDLAFIGDQLYLTSARTDFDALTAYEELIAIDPTNGQGTLIGNLGVVDYNVGSRTGFLTVWGLATPDHVNLYGVLGTQVISINPVTAAGTLLVNNYAVSPFNVLGGANGAAIGTEAVAVVPLPAAGWLLATGLGPLLFAAGKRSSRRKGLDNIRVPGLRT